MAFEDLFAKLLQQFKILMLVVMFSLPTITSHASVELEKGLVLYWNMDAVDIDWEKKKILDRSDRGHTGTLVGFNESTHLCPGKIGQALKFSSTDTAIFTLGSQSLNHRINNSYSYSVWFNLESFPSKWTTIFYKDAYQQLSLNVGLLLLRSGVELDQIVKYGSPIKNLDQWYHLVATFNGSKQVLYVNGSLIISNRTIGSTGGINALRIGGRDNTDFAGLIDEVRVYDRALTAAEVLALYYATSFDTTPLPSPTAPKGFHSTAKSTSSITMAWSINDTRANKFRLYRNSILIAEIDRDVSFFKVSNLKPGTNYDFRISAVNSAKREGPKSSVLSISTKPKMALQVSPAQYLAGQSPPKFKMGHSLLPLSKFSWPFSYDTIIEMAHWGYALDFGDANAQSISKLDDPNSIQAKLVALVVEKPELYRLSVNIPRIHSDQIPSTAYTLDGSGNPTKIWSPEAPDSIMYDMATTVAGYLKKILGQVPITIILNGGERHLRVIGHDILAWASDAKIATSKGELSWPEYISKNKARQEMFFTNAIKSLTTAPYIWYSAGGNQHRARRSTSWYNWDWDYRWMHTVTDYPNNSLYWDQFNTGWLTDDKKNDMLSQLINATGYAVTFGQPLAYNWVCAGWLRPSSPNRGLGDIERYHGFLKSAYTVGMIGAVAGYFEYPDEGFNATFSSNDPPHWLEQIEALGQVHAEFSYLEDFLRFGDLLSGPIMNEKNPEQPAYEFFSGHANTRILVRKLRNSKRWIITAWAADGVVRTVSVTIPVLGIVKVQAYPAGSIYHAQVVEGQTVITTLDLGLRIPSPLQLPNADKKNSNLQTSMELQIND